MKLAMLTFSFILFLTLIGGAEAASEQRGIAGSKETKREKKTRVENLRARLQGFNGQMRI